MLPLRYDSFDNDYICGKGDSSRLTVFVLGDKWNFFCFVKVLGIIFEVPFFVLTIELLYYNNIQMDNELHKLHYWAYIEELKLLSSFNIAAAGSNQPGFAAPWGRGSHGVCGC